MGRKSKQKRDKLAKRNLNDIRLFTGKNKQANNDFADFISHGDSDDVTRLTVRYVAMHPLLQANAAIRFMAASLHEKRHSLELIDVDTREGFYVSVRQPLSEIRKRLQSQGIDDEVISVARANLGQKLATGNLYYPPLLLMFQDFKLDIAITKLFFLEKVTNDDARDGYKFLCVKNHEFDSDEQRLELALAKRQKILNGDV